MASSDDQVTKLQILGIVVNKRNSLFLSQGNVITGPVVRWVTPDGCFPECDSHLSVPVPTLSWESALTFEEDTPVGLISSAVLQHALISALVPC